MRTALTSEDRELIRDWPLGFVASADAEGRPNLSPKGTFIVCDDTTIAFAEMRSPNTVRNLAVRADVAVNFVDVLTRKGLVVQGTARTVAKGEPGYGELLPPFLDIWGESLEALFNGIVVIDISACRAIRSPAYEAGATEAGLRNDWKERIEAIYERQVNG